MSLINRISHWRFRQRPTARNLLSLESLEDRTLLSGPGSSLLSLPNLSLNGPLNSLTSLVSNPLANVVNPLLSSIVNPLISPIVNPLINPIGNPLINPTVSQLVTPVGGLLPGPVSSLPTSLPTTVAATVSSLPIFVAPGVYQSSAGSVNGSIPGRPSGFGGPGFRFGSEQTAYAFGSSTPSLRFGGYRAATTTPQFANELAVTGPEFVMGIESIDLDRDDVITIDFSDVALSFGDDLTVDDFAAALLTGIKPRANLLPQKGAQVAPLATLVSGDTTDAASGVSQDGNAEMSDLLINPAVRFPVDSAATLTPLGGQSKAPSNDSRWQADSDQPAASEKQEAWSHLATGFSLALAFAWLSTFVGRHRAKPATDALRSSQVPS
ncbi:MAG TPA: hypothetical protein VGX70_18845 [Gemmataceae bacterium]|nr:hypothetical protein [Gemmataceae bacterium]